ncbi:hypothetical protein AB0758_30670 [Tolypothrix bouteillei VB521301_2]
MGQIYQVRGRKASRILLLLYRKAPPQYCPPTPLAAPVAVKKTIASRQS